MNHIESYLVIIWSEKSLIMDLTIKLLENKEIIVLGLIPNP
jgi:hypothetical protein